MDEPLGCDGTGDSEATVSAPGINPRQRRMVEGIVLRGLSATEAYRQAGYASREHADSAAANVLSRVGVREYMRALMDEAGLSDELLVERIRQGLDAEAHAVTRAGEVVSLGPDWHARYKLIELALKVRDRMPDPRVQVAAVGGAVVIRHTPSLD